MKAGSGVKNVQIVGRIANESVPAGMEEVQAAKPLLSSLPVSTSLRWSCLSSLKSFSAGHAALQLFKPVLHDVDLVHRGGMFRAWSLQHGETFAVWVQIKVIVGGAVGELAGRPKLGLVGMEGVAGSSVSHRHDLAVRRTIKKLLAVARPFGKDAAARGNLPFATWAGERLNVHFEVAGFN